MPQKNPATLNPTTINPPLRKRLQLGADRWLEPQRNTNNTQSPRDVSGDAIFIRSVLHGRDVAVSLVSCRTRLWSHQSVIAVTRCRHHVWTGLTFRAGGEQRKRDSEALALWWIAVRAHF
jgi:hypothetical protein